MNPYPNLLPQYLGGQNRKKSDFVSDHDKHPNVKKGVVNNSPAHTKRTAK